MRCNFAAKQQKIKEWREEETELNVRYALLEFIARDIEYEYKSADENLETLLSDV